MVVSWQNAESRCYSVGGSPALSWRLVAAAALLIATLRFFAFARAALLCFRIACFAAECVLLGMVFPLRDIYATFVTRRNVRRRYSLKLRHGSSRLIFHVPLQPCSALLPHAGECREACMLFLREHQERPGKHLGSDNRAGDATVALSGMTARCAERWFRSQSPGIDRLMFGRSLFFPSS
jgi:hypothetical protein